MGFLRLDGNVEGVADVGVILPTFCEAQNIEKLINEIESLNMNVSILVVDDSSSDGTADVVRRLQRTYDNVLLLVRPGKMGLGTAIIDGFKVFMSMKNAPKYVVTMDADYSHDPKDIPRLLSAIKGGYSLVIGSRYCKGGGIINWSFLRLMISKIANQLAAVVVGEQINDYTSGMRCYSMSLIRSIINDLHSQTYEIQIETIRQALMRGFSVGEIPITFVNRKKGKSKLTANEIKYFLSYMLKLTLKRICGFLASRETAVSRL